MEYYQYFRLKGHPFQPASPQGAVYFSSNHLQGLATLEAGLLGEMSGLTMLTGEAGTGKTTLIYSLLQRDHKRVRIAHIDDPKLSFPEIMRVILTQLHLYSAGSTKLDYLSALDHLLELHGEQERIAVVVDESQVLSDDVLEELRLLSNRGQRDGRRLQLILVGQPELAERLKKPELRQLNQRIFSRGVLKPLDHAQAVMYVECRLSAQGGKCSAIFESRALNRLLRRSDGIPRKINMLCHNAMLAAFYAGERKVSLKTATKVAAEYHDAVGVTTRKSGMPDLAMPALIAGGALVSLLLLGFVYPRVWPDWLFHRTVSSGKANELKVQPESRATRHRKASGIRREAKAATSLTSHPGESGALPAPGAASPAAAAATRMPPAASAAVSAGVQKPAGAPAAPERRSQITVKYGDTLEKIAIRYSGSKDGIGEFIAANPQLTNINQLSVGQIIYLPRGITPKASHDQAAAVQTPGARDAAAR